MIGRRLSLLLAALLAVPAALQAQQGSVESRLEARGLPVDLAQQIGRVASDAAAQGVPAEPLADKAIEGWAKHVAADRIVAAVRQFADRMAQASAAVRAAGLATPPGRVIAAAAEAMGGGLDRDEIESIVRAAGSAETAAPGLSVAAALAAQGIGGKRAVSIVVRALERHRPMSQLLDLPSVASSMHERGMSPGEIGDRLLPNRGDDGGPDADRRGSGSSSGSNKGGRPNNPGSP